MENERTQSNPRKAPAIAEPGSSQPQINSEQWIIRALNNLQEEIGRLRNSLDMLSDRVGKLEGWIKWGGGVVSTITFLILLFVLLSRLGLDISVTMKPENIGTSLPAKVPIVQE